MKHVNSVTKNIQTSFSSIIKVILKNNNKPVSFYFEYLSSHKIQKNLTDFAKLL